MYLLRSTINIESIISECSSRELWILPLKILMISILLLSFRNPVATARCLFDSYIMQVGFISVLIVFKIKYLFFFSSSSFIPEKDCSARVSIICLVASSSTFYWVRHGINRIMWIFFDFIAQAISEVFFSFSLDVSSTFLISTIELYDMASCRCIVMTWPWSLGCWVPLKTLL